jgi:hypothetical protein
MEFLLKPAGSDVTIAPSTGLDIMWWVRHWALPDVVLFRAYGLFQNFNLAKSLSFYIRNGFISHS